MLSKKTILLLISIFICLFLIIKLLIPPSYTNILVLAQNLMKKTGNINISYDIEYSSIINGSYITGKSKADYNVIGNNTKWNNSLPFENAILKIRPDKLPELMKLGNLNSLEYLKGNCYLLNSFINDVNFSFNYVYIRVISCFNKTNGYPVSYSILIEGEDNGTLVSYKPSFKPKPFNKSLLEFQT